MTESRMLPLAVQSAVLVSCKLPEQRIDTVAQYQAFLAHEMAHMAINQRLFKISRQVRPHAANSDPSKAQRRSCAPTSR